MLDEISDIVVQCGVEPDQAPDAHLSLELAALLGPQIHADEWCVACELCGVEASEELVGELAHKGLATRSEDGWAFEDDSLVDALVGYVKQAHAWKSHHFACANALFVVAPTQRPGLARRRVAHLIEAGSVEEALEPLLVAEREAYDNGDYDDSHAYLDTRESLLDELGAEADDPRRAQNDWRRAQLLQVHGERAEALALVDKSRRLLRCTDWASEQGHAALLHGRHRSGLVGPQGSRPRRSPGSSRGKGDGRHARTSLRL